MAPVSGSKETTQFITPFRMMMIAALISAFVSYGFTFLPRYLHPLASTPVFYLLTSQMLKRDDHDTGLSMQAKRVITAVIWTLNSSLVALVTSSFFGVKFTPYHTLLCFVPIGLIMSRKSRDSQYSLVAQVLMHVLYDVPLLISGYICLLFNIRLFAPFFNIMDKNIIQGSLPYPQDVKKMASAGVTAVVNMTIEYPGPVGGYNKYGIEQLRLPFVDTTPPSADGLRKGAAFIKSHLEANPKGKVYIHCKGGIARASTMTLAHYILNHNETDTGKRIAEMISRRPVVFAGVQEFRSIRELVNEVRKRK